MTDREPASMSEALSLAEIPSDYSSFTIKETQEAQAELRRLHAENEALRADAERYRWLRDKADYMRVPEGSPQVLMTDEFGNPVSIYREAYPQGETLDDAIDSARKEST